MKINKEILLVKVAEKRWSLKKLSENAGVSTQTISKLINTTYDCNTQTIGKIAQALVVSVEDIIVKEDENIESSEG